MPVSSLVPYTATFIAIVFGVGVALYGHYKNRRHTENENRYRKRSPERKKCMKCYDFILGEPGTKKLKCTKCKTTIREGDSLFHEKCSEIGECGNCVCHVCDQELSDWRFKFARCSLCKGKNLIVHEDCADEVVICQDCLQKKSLGTCPACPRLLTRHKLKKAKCHKCAKTELVVHSACELKRVLCKDCKVVGKCSVCKENILGRDDHRTVRCLICRAVCRIHQHCVREVIKCEACSRKIPEKCMVCQEKIVVHISQLEEIHCYSCKKDLILHQSCFIRKWMTILECEECLSEKVIGICDVCHKDILGCHQTEKPSCVHCKQTYAVHKECNKNKLECKECLDQRIGSCYSCNKDILRRHQTKQTPFNRRCANCDRQPLFHKECYKNRREQEMKCAKCIDKKVIGTCHECHKDILGLHKYMETVENANCLICKDPCVLHKECKKEVTKCKDCLSSTTPEYCFICNSSVINHSNTLVFNCKECRQWRRVAHTKCAEDHKLTEKTKGTLTCPSCLAEQ